MVEKNKTMTPLVMVEVDEIHFEEEEDDFREKIFQIYLTHFLVVVFEVEDNQVEDKQKDEEKTLNMIYILI
jgi:hypothetical protein